MIYFEICKHNKVTITGGKETHACELCNGPVNETHYVPDVSPKFNLGLGMITYGTRDAEKKAKARGLMPIGDAKINQVFSRPKSDITPILEEGMRRVRAQKIKNGEM